MLALLATFLLATPAQLELGAHSRLFIDGDSNVRRWSCDSGEVQLAATVETGSDRQPPSVHSLIIEVAVGSPSRVRSEQPDVPDRGFTSESNFEIVIELEPVRGAADLSVSHRPGTARLVAPRPRA
jgi:hypothetical protein